jgi:hypothetical protein
MSIQLDFSHILVILFGLLVLGIIYNLIIARLERNGYLEGFTSLAVVGGVGMVLGGLALINWQWALISLAAFACAGLPMVVGSIGRYAQQRKEGQDSMRRLDE